MDAATFTSDHQLGVIFRPPWAENVCSIFRRYSGHAIFARNLLIGVAENAKTGSNPYS